MEFLFSDQCDWLLNVSMVPLVPLTPSFIPDNNHTEGIKKLDPNYIVDFGKGYLIIQIIDNCPPKFTLHSVCVDSASKPSNLGPV